MSKSLEMVKLAKTALEDKKAGDIKVIDISGVSVLADYFIIADGSNVNQVQAMVDNVDEVLGRAGYECKQMEGYGTGGWILMVTAISLFTHSAEKTGYSMTWKESGAMVRCWMRAS